MKIRIAIALTLATGILAGCSSMKVSTEHDKEFDFGKVQTYQWIAGPRLIRFSVVSSCSKGLCKNL